MAIWVLKFLQKKSRSECVRKPTSSSILQLERVAGPESIKLSGYDVIKTESTSELATLGSVGKQRRITYTLFEGGKCYWLTTQMFEGHQKLKRESALAVMDSLKKL